jgi:hypothetical protein
MGRPVGPYYLESKTIGPITIQFVSGGGEPDELHVAWAIPTGISISDALFEKAPRIRVSHVYLRDDDLDGTIDEALTLVREEDPLSAGSSDLAIREFSGLNARSAHIAYRVVLAHLPKGLPKQMPKELASAVH